MVEYALLTAGVLLDQATARVARVAAGIDWVAVASVAGGVLLVRLVLASYSRPHS